MENQQFDITTVKAVDHTKDPAKVNRMLAEGWVLLKVSESQWRDDDGALVSDVYYTLGSAEV